MDRQHRVGWSRKRFARLPQMIRNQNVSIQTSEEMGKIHHPCVFHSVNGIIDVDRTHTTQECLRICSQKDIPEWALCSMPWLNQDNNNAYGASSSVADTSYKLYSQYTPLKRMEGNTPSHTNSSQSYAVSPSVPNSFPVVAGRENLYCTPSALPANVACILPFGPEGQTRPLVSPFLCLDSFIRRRQFLTSLHKIEKVRGVVTRIDSKGLHVQLCSIPKGNNSTEVSRQIYGFLSSLSLPNTSETPVELNIASLNMICICPYTELPPTWQACIYEKLPQQFHPFSKLEEDLQSLLPGEEPSLLPSNEVCETGMKSMACIGDVLDFVVTTDCANDNFLPASYPRKLDDKEDIQMLAVNCGVTLRLGDEADVLIHRDVSMKTGLLDAYRNQPSQKQNQPPPEVQLSLNHSEASAPSKSALENRKYSINNNTQDVFPLKVTRQVSCVNPRLLEVLISCYGIAQYGSFLSNNVLLRREEKLPFLQTAQTHSWCIHGLQKGQDFYNRHMYEQASKCFAHALYIQDKPDAVCLLAQCHVAMKQPNAAKELLVDRISKCKATHEQNDLIDGECKVCNRYMLLTQSISHGTPTVTPSSNTNNNNSNNISNISNSNNNIQKRKIEDPCGSTATNTPLEEERKKKYTSNHDNHDNRDTLSNLTNLNNTEDLLILGDIPTSQPAIVSTPSPAPQTSFLQEIPLLPLDKGKGLGPQPQLDHTQPQLQQTYSQLDALSGSNLPENLELSGIVLLQSTLAPVDNPTVHMDYDLLEHQTGTYNMDEDEDGDDFEQTLLQLEDREEMLHDEGDGWGQSPYTSPVTLSRDALDYNSEND